MTRLLFVSHAPSANTRALRAAAERAIGEFAELDYESLDSLSADAEALRRCNGLLLGTTENFGSMAGLTKDFLERIYYPCLEQTEALPVACYIRAGLDGQGTVTALQRIITGLRWRLIQPPLVLHGDYTTEFCNEVSELAATLAAGLDAGLF